MSTRVAFIQDEKSTSVRSVYPKTLAAFTLRGFAISNAYSIFRNPIMGARIDHPAVREQARMLVATVGYKEASIRTGITEPTLRQWNSRFKWKHVPTHSQAIVTTVTKPSDALAEALADDNRETKLSLSKGLRKAAKEMEEMPGRTIYASADKAKHLVGAASQIHGWQETKEAGINLNVLSIGGEMAVQINQKD